MSKTEHAGSPAEIAANVRDLRLAARILLKRAEEIELRAGLVGVACSGSEWRVVRQAESESSRGAATAPACDARAKRNGHVKLVAEAVGASDSRVAPRRGGNNGPFEK